LVCAFRVDVGSKLQRVSAIWVFAVVWSSLSWTILVVACRICGMRSALMPIVCCGVLVVGLVACGHQPAVVGAPSAAGSSNVPRQPADASLQQGLPKETVFKGQERFNALVAMAERENWRALPLGKRTIRVARELEGTPYVNFTLEIDDHIEAPSVNMHGMDCWTFYEISLAFARMLHWKDGPYTPHDLLAMIELERYRGGRCDGNYLSRMHFLEELYYDNEKRGLAVNITRQLGGERIQRNIQEMTVGWRNYRYLRNNPELRKKMADIERAVSALPVYHIPKSRVAAVESRLRDGDVVAITTTWHGSYTSHVGLAVTDGRGHARLMHATSDRSKGRQVITDRRISEYLAENSNRAGIIVLRPHEVPSMRAAQRRSPQQPDSSLLAAGGLPESPVSRQP